MILIIFCDLAHEEDKKVIKITFATWHMREEKKEIQITFSSFKFQVSSLKGSGGRGGRLSSSD